MGHEKLRQSRRCKGKFDAQEDCLMLEDKGDNMVTVIGCRGYRTRVE